MRTSLHCAIAVLVGGLGGWGVKALLQHPQAEASITSSSQNVETSTRTPARAGLAASGKQDTNTKRHDLRTLLADFERRGCLPEDAARSIERMGTDQLKDAYLKLTASTAKPFSPGGDQWLRISLVTLMSNELYRRDPDGTLEWAEKGGPATAGLYDNVLKLGMAADPSWAKPYFDKVRESRGEQWVKTQIQEAYNGAAERGAEAVLETLSLFAEDQKKAGRNGMSLFFPTGYAENFDFATFLANPATTPSSLGPAVSYWSASDPEAAFAALKDQAKQKPYAFPAMVTGVADINGYEAAAKWAAAKLDELPADQRASSAGSLAIIGDSFPAKVQIFMSALSNPDDKLAYASSTFSAVIWSTSASDVRATAGMEALQLLGTEELQAQAMTLNARGLSRNLDDTRKALARQRLSETMNTLHFSEASKASVLAALE